MQPTGELNQRGRVQRLKEGAVHASDVDRGCLAHRLHSESDRRPRRYPDHPLRVTSPQFRQGEVNGYAAEKAARDKARTDRLRLLRFLKEERVAGVSQAAEVLGYSVRTVQRWWQCYRAGGLAALLAPPRRRGAKERLSPEAWEGLQAEMRAGHIGGLHEAQLYLRDTWHIAYGIDAISKLFRRRKTKLKTGRPHHRKAASPTDQAAFKK